MSKATESIPRNPLRPNQTTELKLEQKRLREIAKRPDVDKGETRKQLNSIGSMIDNQSAKQLAGQDLDLAKSRIETLKVDIAKGMPTDEEMRKCPPGAVGRHMEWEKRTKESVSEYKRLMIATNTGSDDPELASIERLRPTKNTLNMHNAVVSTADHHGINTAAPAKVLNDEQLALIKERAPFEIHSKLCFMDAEGRSMVLADYVTNYVEPKDSKTLSTRK
tara:strand:+ start:32266 stop:32928 length:663 start_codon:yes stop_codon:yes gene_type:complete